MCWLFGSAGSSGRAAGMTNVLGVDSVAGEVSVDDGFVVVDAPSTVVGGGSVATADHDEAVVASAVTSVEVSVVGG